MYLYISDVLKKCRDLISSLFLEKKWSDLINQYLSIYRGYFFNQTSKHFQKIKYQTEFCESKSS